jgi:organic radical activating enzyme
MKLREPFYYEDMGLNQPYLSMFFIAPYCDFTCKDCQNLHLKDNNIQDFTIEELSKLYKDNPFYQGITVGGLEPFLSKADCTYYGNCEAWIPIQDQLDTILHDIQKFIMLNKIQKVTIYTRFTLEYNNISSYIKCLKNLDCIKELYLKTGEYIEGSNSKIVTIPGWSITLASDNQNFEKIK